MKPHQPASDLIACTPHGTWRVAGTRVSVDSVVQTYWAGATPEEICQDFPTLSLGQVYGVIAYFLARRDDVDAYLKQQQRAAARLRRQLKALHRDFLVDLRRRMLARRHGQAHAA